MVVAVVQVGVMRMAVLQALVPMVMAVLLCVVPEGGVLMSVMLVVHMTMGVLQRFVAVRVLVTLSQV